MPVRLDKIEGVVPKKKQAIYINQKRVAQYLEKVKIIEEQVTFDLREEGFNQAIDQIGQVEITLNREKLAKELWIIDNGYPKSIAINKIWLDTPRREKYLKFAEYINSKLPEIVERVK